MELRDRLDQISTTIQELRQASADGRQSRQLIDSLFRTVHTFKAAASAEGLNDLSRTAHEFEDLLHALRTGRVILDAEVLRVFDETVATLRNGSAISLSNRVSQLSSNVPLSKNEVPPEFVSLRDEERHRAAAALREGSNLYLMEVAFEATDFDEPFRWLKEQLEKTAEIISTSVRMQDDKIIFHVVYASQSEKTPIRTVLQQALLAGQTVAATLGKQVEFVVKSEELLLDKSVSDSLADALLHLVRNAVDHGIESRGKVALEVTAEAGQVSVCVSDDGRGIAPENLPFVFQPGFSTANSVTDLSGRGVGLDVVATTIQELGGTVTVTSEPGNGSSFKITLPNPSSDA